jgi:hypothetical protein
MESDAKEAQVVHLLAGFSGSPITDTTVDVYLGSIEEYSLEAVTLACRRFVAGDVPGQNKSWRPSVAELVEQVRLFANAIKFRDDAKKDQPALISYPIGAEPPPPAVPLGPIEVCFGGRTIDMRDMNPEGKEFVMEHRRLPDETEQIVPRLRKMP